MTHPEQTLLAIWHHTMHPGARLQLPAALPGLARLLSRALPLDGLTWLVPEPDHRQLHGWYCGADDGQLRPLQLQAGALDALSSLSAWCACAAIEVVEHGQRLHWLTALPALAQICPELDSPATVLVALGLAGSQGTRALLLLHLPAHADHGRQHDFYAGTASCLSAWLDVLTLRRELADLHELISQLRDRGSTSPASEPIVGAQSGLRPVLERVRMVAATDVPVLILGETGSGKEVIARAIHQDSPRAGESFVRVNCGALPPELIDSELFGHEKGAFTGANAARRGWFEQADRGTLFLDEIGELPLPAQVRLLRVLQDGSLNRVGSEASLHVDVRVVAATHRDLPAMVLAGRFREDLWYRLATFPVLLPPLRERRADIAELAAHFARRAAHRFGFPVVQPTQADVALLAGYDWPGNVREFAAVIDRALLLGEGRALDVATALGSPRVQAVAAVSDSTVLPPSDRPAAVALPTLEEAMRTHIARALEQTGGRLEGPHGAARVLAINPHTLRARMRKLGLDPAQFRPRSQYLQSGPR